MVQFSGLGHIDLHSPCKSLGFVAPKTAGAASERRTIAFALEPGVGSRFRLEVLLFIFRLLYSRCNEVSGHEASSLSPSNRPPGKPQNSNSADDGKHDHEHCAWQG